MWLLNPGSEPFCFTEQYPPKVCAHTPTHILTHTSKKWIPNRIQLKSKMCIWYVPFVSITWILGCSLLFKDCVWTHNVCGNHKPWCTKASYRIGKWLKSVTAVILVEPQFQSNTFVCPSDFLARLHTTAPNPLHGGGVCTKASPIPV